MKLSDVLYSLTDLPGESLLTTCQICLLLKDLDDFANYATKLDNFVRDLLLPI